MPTGTQVGAKEWADGAALGHDGAIAYLAEFLRSQGKDHRLLAVGHRVVHGALEFTRPALVTPAVLAALGKLSPLAPLHQPHNLKAIEVIAQLQPELPQVACFDTAFHRSQPEVAQAYALPASITGRGVRRYGFHGLSYEYIASVLPQLDARAAAGRTLVAHLGNGSSLCALVAGRSVASTMGFTAVDGLPMGTRCGNLDPGVILYLLDELKMDARAIEKLIYQQSGLLGVSGLSSDMRSLLASDDAQARFAVELYTLPHRARDRLAGRRGARHRCAGLHRGHRRACGGDPRARLPPGRVAGRGDRCPGQCRRGSRASARPRAGSPSG